MIVVYVWIALALFGIWLSIRNGLEAYRDFQALGGLANGRRTLAVANLRREIVRGLVHVDFITIGLLVLLEMRSVAAPGLILGAAGLVLNSYLDRRDRIYLMEHSIAETQDQREDRQFGEVRRDLEQKHRDDE